MSGVPCNMSFPEVPILRSGYGIPPPPSPAAEILVEDETGALAQLPRQDAATSEVGGGVIYSTCASGIFGCDPVLYMPPASVVSSDNARVESAHRLAMEVFARGATDEFLQPKVISEISPAPVLTLVKPATEIAGLMDSLTLEPSALPFIIVGDASEEEMRAQIVAQQDEILERVERERGVCSMSSVPLMEDSHALTATASMLGGRSMGSGACTGFEDVVTLSWLHSATTSEGLSAAKRTLAAKHLNHRI